MTQCLLTVRINDHGRDTILRSKASIMPANLLILAISLSRFLNHSMSNLSLLRGLDWNDEDLDSLVPCTITAVVSGRDAPSPCTRTAYLMAGGRCPSTGSRVEQCCPGIPCAGFIAAVARHVPARPPLGRGALPRAGEWEGYESHTELRALAVALQRAGREVHS